MFMLFQRVVVAIATNVRENKNGGSKYYLYCTSTFFIS